MQSAFSLLQDIFDASIRFHPIYVVPFFLIAFVLYIKRGKRDGFWGWVFPKDMYMHASSIVDLKIFIFSRFMIFAQLFNMVFVHVFFAFLGMASVSVLTGWEMSTHPVTVERVLLVTLISSLVSDFCTYWVHRLHHEWPVIWPFHSVHHSAEVMTPVTVYRKHPVYDLISSVVKAVLIGFVQGIILMVLLGQIQLSLIMGVNIFYFVFNLVGSNFRHSHIWFSYGRALEHIFISPAQHQIHHSLEPKHHNKNYGEILAIWDWMFGTLYIPEGYEELSYGISKSSHSNERIAQPHKTLKEALIVPFQDSWKAIQRRLLK